MPASADRLVPLLIEVQQNLDRDIDLAALAARYGASAFHFHRTFAATVGETPKKHVERLRLEKAALLVAVTDEPILEIALAVGFNNHETFCRNFKKFLGFTPTGYRRMAKRAQAERLARTDFHADPAYTLSRARFVRLAAKPLLAVHHIGDYGALHARFGTADDPWDEACRWAADHGLRLGHERIGIYYDDPTLTPKPLQRADVCVALRGSAARAAQVVEGIPGTRVLAFEGGLHAVTDFVGGVESVLSAFRGTADEIRRSKAYTFRNAPPLEVVRATNVDGISGRHRLEVCFPVQRTTR